MTGSAIAERKGVGLLALLSIGILLASLMLALRPTPSLAGDPGECERPLDVMLIIDRSGSMDTEQSGQSRLEWAQQAASDFLADLDAAGGIGGSGLHRVGLVSYGGNTGDLTAAVLHDSLSAGASAGTIDGHIGALNASGNTPLEQGITAGGNDMATNARTEVDGVAVHHVLILLSDGRPWPAGNATDPRLPDTTPITNYLASADEAFGIAIGEGGTGAFNPDLDLMHDLSQPDPGNFRHILDAGDLPDLFADIAEEILCGDIDIDKVANPAGPVEPGTSVTYNYEVTNGGDAPLINVVVTDDTCPPPAGGVLTRTGGDDGDNQLENGEVWTYECTMTLDDTTTNEACAEGDFIGGGSDSDCADVTVEVLPPSEEESPSESASPSESSTPEGSQAGQTGTPAGSVPDTALSIPGFGGPLATLIFGAILVASLGTLAYANVRAARQRR